MAANDRPARLALAAAVVALLLGATGVLVRHQVLATTTAAATAVAAEPGVVPPMTRRFGGGVLLDGPSRPVRIPVPGAPPAGFAPVVIAANGTRLVPAAYDGATRSLVAQVAYPGGFWGGLLDLAALGREGGPAPRPDCAGRAASADGVTVDAGEPDPRAPVWVCVTAGNGHANITLTSNSAVPYRIVPPPAWPGPATRTAAASTSAVQLLGRPRQRDLLWPGAGVTYTVPFGLLPARIRGQADPGPALGTALATAAHRAAGLFGLAGGSGPAAGVLACAADAGAARYTPDRPFADVAADVWAALEPCHPDGGVVVRRLVAADVGAVTSGVAGASPAFEIPVTTSRAQRFTQVLQYRPRAAAVRASGTCAAVSAVSGRHDAYRCSAGGTTYDPCFAGPGPRPRITCPTSATRAVLLTYSGALPTPPQPGGTADPFLLVLADGLQCAAVAAPEVRYACSDGRTVLHEEPDTSGPLWTIEARTITKAYA
ncbi:hypothetical protein AB0J55_14285 [Amycolatopsis sp. NPDC049688]|uniref:hypothetical protein n=1 Tax=Amycolatopsis sp. NPDC049688 TaxID=3154733 RepID=UPI00341B53C1